MTRCPRADTGRTIILADTSSFYLHVHRESTTPLRNENYSYLYPGVVNQENNGTFENTQVNAFRTIIQHEWTAWTEFYPYPDGRETAPWPAPAELNPYPATTINQ